jgi:hypothetical protein
MQIYLDKSKLFPYYSIDLNIGETNMESGYDVAIESLKKELEQIEKKASEIKSTINKLSALADKPQPYADAELTTFSHSVALRPDQFFGRGLSTAVREFLKIRGSACTAQEILEGLKAGGFEIPEDWQEKHYLKNLAISLSKNSNDFVYVKQSNAYGLWEFYPERVREKKKSSRSNGSEKTEERATSEPEQK